MTEIPGEMMESILIGEPCPLTPEQHARILALEAARSALGTSSTFGGGALPANRGAGDLTYLAEWILEGYESHGLKPEITGETSDGFHTFNELYRHRAALSANLWNAWSKLADLGHGGWVGGGITKSRRHSDGTMLPPTDGVEWFIVTAWIDDFGQVSYHYPMTQWDMFKVPEVDRAPEYDEHTADDVARRLEQNALRG
jgi:hypothetical protein